MTVKNFKHIVLLFYVLISKLHLYMTHIFFFKGNNFSNYVNKFLLVLVMMNLIVIIGH